ncbi:MarR family winged helix-turn-helix transcriptional regulator [Rhizobium sp. TRM95111]|uniref:MarR family winged helix-turn-helix transcriptional regulator n=1 Tax=Rhizobium alarense TaxID=2846851 RepID=UPI001F1AC638|nr:MarR family winged helix-turn-helix transcriptional regulator [Rhizobium alarense]MCF3642677.1 MarR family winged helix-turn-helix transcriptional regulator [Rhizobium alarense]
MTDENGKSAETGTLPATYVLGEQIGFFLRQANQRHVAIFASLMNDKLTTTQWAALTKLKEVQPCSQNQLGRDIAMDVATIKGVVDRLVKRGFVSTSPDRTDARRLVLSLTEEGLTAIDQNVALALDVSEQTLSPLTPAERMMLIELLRKIS